MPIEQDIWWNVRGSGAGSVVAYSLGITRIDPVQHDLIFERFLNPERVTMPDVDLDYPDDRRARNDRLYLAEIWRRQGGQDHHLWDPGRAARRCATWGARSTCP